MKPKKKLVWIIPIAVTLVAVLVQTFTYMYKLELSSLFALGLAIAKVFSWKDLRF